MCECVLAVRMCVHSQFIDCLFEVNLTDLPHHDLHHFLADGATLRGLSVRSLLDLIGLSLCEADTENTEEIPISGLDVNMCLNKSLKPGKEVELVNKTNTRLRWSSMSNFSQHE